MSWFGATSEGLALALSLPRVEAHASLSSTMDEAHALAAGGAAAGTLVLAERQTAGRGRAGKRWDSEPCAGIWATLIERPRDASGLEVLSLRVGLRLARVLARWSEPPIQVKWPNDVFAGGRKLAGVLIEARWREQRPDWVAIGIGINLLPPLDQPSATSLEDADALEVLAELVPALRAAAFSSGPLTAEELGDFALRDFSRDRQVVAPASGVARGITADGALLIEASDGVVMPYRTGSLVLSS